MIRLMVDNKQVEIDWVKFSDDAITCKVLDLPESFRKAWITVDPTTPVKDVLLEVLMVRESLVCSHNKSLEFIGLNVPYMPFARGDRIFEKGNPLPLQIFLDQILDSFDEILTIDIHNPDWGKGINVIPQHVALKETIKHLSSYDYVVAPDKGALKKIYSLDMPVITATKIRDLSTGRIIETMLDADVNLEGTKLLIVDDILDGGGTFIPLAEKLKRLGAHVDLYVTHLIAAKGLDIFKGKIDNIYCYHTVGNYVNLHTVLNYNKGV